MKRFFFLSLTLLALTIFSACSKDEEPSPAPYVSVDDSMTGSMDGSELSVVDYTYIIPSSSADPGQMELRFYTKADLTEYISVFVPSSIVPGTYDLTDSGLESIYYLASDGDYVSTSGTLQIERHDKTNHVVVGNFEASMVPTPTSTATSTHDFTNMKFVLNYTL